MKLFSNCDCANANFTAVAKFLGMKLQFEKSDKCDCEVLVDGQVSVYHAPAIVFYLMRKAEILPQSEAKLAEIDTVLQAIYSLIGAVSCAMQNENKFYAEKVEAKLACWNGSLEGKTYLVGDRMSVSDVFVGHVFAGVFKHMICQKEAEKYSNIVRFVMTVCGSISYKQ